MALPIISADQRMAEVRGVKGCIFGKSGIGKTSLLWTLDPKVTLFIDLEAGDLAIEGWSGDSVRPRTWPECRDFAVFIGGPNPALRDEQVAADCAVDRGSLLQLLDEVLRLGRGSQKLHAVVSRLLPGGNQSGRALLCTTGGKIVRSLFNSGSTLMKVAIMRKT